MTFPSSPFPRATFTGNAPCSTPFSEFGPTLPSPTINRVVKSIGLPKCERCNTHECMLPYYRWERDCGYHFNSDRHVHFPPRDFPILRSSPLWQQTWVVRTAPPTLQSIYKARYDGYEPDQQGTWFPPVSCAGTPGRRIILAPQGNGARNLWRLYTVDSCPDCIAALQAVELMVYGSAYTVQTWPDDWEHRCFHRGPNESWTPDDFGMERCACGRESLLDYGIVDGVSDPGWVRAANEWLYENQRANLGGSIRGYNWTCVALDEPSESDAIEMRFRSYANVIVTGPRVFDPD